MPCFVWVIKYFSTSGFRVLSCTEIPNEKIRCRFFFIQFHDIVQQSEHTECKRLDINKQIIRLVYERHIEKNANTYGKKIYRSSRTHSLTYSTAYDFFSVGN